MKSFLLKFACAALIFGSVFGIVDSLDKTNAQSVPIKTFRTSYKGYTPSLAKKTKYYSSSKMHTSKPIYGAKPAAAGNNPVLLYIHGTFGDIGGNAEGKAFVEWAASQGFIAFALTYISSSTNLIPAMLDMRTACSTKPPFQTVFRSMFGYRRRLY